MSARVTGLIICDHGKLSGRITPKCCMQGLFEANSPREAVAGMRDGPGSLRGRGVDSAVRVIPPARAWARANFIFLFENGEWGKGKHKIK